MRLFENNCRSQHFSERQQDVHFILIKLMEMEGIEMSTHFHSLKLAASIMTDLIFLLQSKAARFYDVGKMTMEITTTYGVA